MQGEVAKTLAHYFQGVIPVGFAKSIGADYDAELSKYPAWAIVNARRWWLSADNGKRRYKPLPGDLAERAEMEMTIVRIAQRRMESAAQEWRVGRSADSEKNKPATPEQRDAIMREYGFPLSFKARETTK